MLCREKLMSLPIGHGRKKLREIDWILAKPLLWFLLILFGIIKHSSVTFQKLYSNTINTEQISYYASGEKRSDFKTNCKFSLINFFSFLLWFFHYDLSSSYKASNKLKSRKEEECEEEENRKCNCIIENLEKKSWE